MRQETQRVFNLILLCFFLGACTTSKLNKRKEAGYPSPPYQKVFKADFAKVWRATQFSLGEYPIRVSSENTGLIETDFIRSDSGWQSPGSKPIPPGGQRYSLRVQLVKGQSLMEQPVETVRVSIVKKIKVHKDFFSKARNIESNGLEELDILYRIGRELKVSSALDRLHKRKSF